MNQSTLFVMLILLICSACERSDYELSHRLDIAESIMEARPDSALDILQQIDGSTLHGENQARHALLLSQALNKNYYDVADDSLISIAYDFYSASGDIRRQMLTNLYYARVLLENKEYGAALSMSLRAEELAIQVGDYSSLARICSQIALIYDATFNHEKGLEYQLKDLKYSEMVGDSAWIHQAKMGLLDCFISTRKLNDASELIAELESDSMTDRLWLLERRIPLLSLLHQHHEIVRIADNDLSDITNLSPSTKAAIALAMNHEGRPTDYAYILERDSNLTRQDSIDIAAIMWELALDRKDYQTAYKYLDIFHTYTCQAFRDVTSNSIHLYQVDYEKSKNREVSLRASLERNRLWSAISISILSIIILATWIFLMRRRFILNKREREAKLSMMLLEYETVQYEKERISNEADNLRNSVLESKNQILKLFTKQFEWIERIGSLYLDASLSTRSNAKAYEKLEKTIKDIRSDRFRNELEAIINSYRDNLLVRIRKTCPSLVQSEINLLIYLCAGIPIRIICLILDKNDNAIYSKKYRIRTKIQHADSALITEMKDIFTV